MARAPQFFLFWGQIFIGFISLKIFDVQGLCFKIKLELGFGLYLCTIIMLHSILQAVEKSRLVFDVFKLNN